MITKWPTVPLGTLFKTSSGATPLKSRKDFYQDGNIPWLLSGEVSQGSINNTRNFITEKALAETAAKLFPVNSVLVAMYGATAGQVGLLGFESATNQAVCAIYPSPDYLPRFVYYALLSMKKVLVSQAVGNAQPNVSQAKIKDLPFPVVSLDEQKRIVAKLDAAQQQFDRLNDNLEQQLSQLTDFDSALLSEMLGDPRHAPEPAVSTHWSVASLGELVDTLGGLWKGKKDPLVQATVIRSTNFGKDQRMNLEDVALLKVEASQFGKRELKHGDLVLEKSGGGPNQPIGRVVVFDLYEAGYSYSNFTNRLRIRDRERVLPEFLHRFLTHFHLRGGTEPIQSNSISIRNLSMPDYLKVRVPLPPLDEQKDIVAKLDEAVYSAALLRSNILSRKKSASELQSSILVAAFAGAL